MGDRCELLRANVVANGSLNLGYEVGRTMTELQSAERFGRGVVILGMNASRLIVLKGGMHADTRFAIANAPSLFHRDLVTQIQHRMQYSSSWTGNHTNPNHH
jgi:hypothetical protein